MLNLTDIYQGIEQCKPLIRNWELMEGIDLDFRDVQIDGLSVDRQPDERDEKWEISLLTTITTHTNAEGRDVYAVRWGFRDLWGNLAFFSLKGYILSGALHLRYIDYDDFALVGFAVVKEDYTPIFEFEQPDEVSVLSVEKKAHQTMREIYPEDYFEDEINFDYHA